jgi:hypothetical protein
MNPAAFTRQLSDVIGRSLAAAIRLPGGRAVRGMTPDSVLDLFDSAKANGLNAPGWYFQGRSMHVNPQGIHGVTAADDSIAMRRKIGMGIAGGAMGAGMLGFDPFGLTSLAGGAANLGFHAGLGGTMFNLGGKTRLLGMGYMGLGVANMFRQGDNIGPY